jgi:hypothetical protein
MQRSALLVLCGKCRQPRRAAPSPQMCLSNRPPHKYSCSVCTGDHRRVCDARGSFLTKCACSAPHPPAEPSVLADSGVARGIDPEEMTTDYGNLHFESAGLCALVAVDAFAPAALPIQNRARLATSSSRPAAAVSLRMSAGAQVHALNLLYTKTVYRRITGIDPSQRLKLTARLSPSPFSTPSLLFAHNRSPPA